VKNIKPSIVFISISIILLIAYFYLSFKNTQSLKSQIVINNKTISVEIANTEKKREKGLSMHQPLSNDEGMLFVFDNPGNYGFWMKDMLFDLDFIWIFNNKIVEITSDVSHNDQRRVYQPKMQVNSVLEVESGFVKRNQIKVGEQIKILSNTIKY
jgi:uncharacterized protein